jgi:long-chain fatty acid transport protein
MLMIRVLRGAFARRRAVYAGGVAVCLMLGAGTAAGQGYGVYEQGACEMGRAGAGVAAPCDDGSAVFFNPAAIVLPRDSRASAGATLIGPRGTFTGFGDAATGTMKKNWLGAPTAYYTRPVRDRLAIGVGTFVPYGLTTEWPLDFAGRFVAYKAVLQSWYVQPTVAYRISDAIAIGGGIDIAFSRLELDQRVDLAAQVLAPGITFAQLGVPIGTDFANFKISGTDTSVAAHVGVLVTTSRSLSLGARYLSRHTVDAEHLDLESTQVATGLRVPVALPGIPAGTPVDGLVAPLFGATGRIGNQQAATRLTVPDQIVVGAAVTPVDRLTLLGDYQLTTWSVFKALEFATDRGLDETIVKNYRNTSGVRLGADYRVTGAVALRAGVLAHQAAAPGGSVTPDLPEGARVELTAGAGVRVQRGVWIDLAYMRLYQQDRSGRVTLTGPDTGTYAFHANLFGASAVIRF